jgi:hypothetical protein
MALPQITYPVYTTQLPSNPKKTVKFRPFLVKEEKALLLAKQSESAANILAATESAIRACVLDKIGELSVLDAEHLFVKIRAKSIGELTEIVIRCQTPGCSGSVNDVVDFDDGVKVAYVEGHSKSIEIAPGVYVNMKYPTMEMAQKRLNSSEQDSMELVIDCVESITHNDEVFRLTESNRQEFVNFFESMTDQQFSKIKNFFDTMPYLGYDKEWDCPVCHSHNHLQLRGIESFF